MTTRFLFSVIPSELYWRDQTIDGLLSALSDDLQQLYETGLSVDHKSKRLTFRLVLIGVKGDWPFLRKEWYDVSRSTMERAHEDANEDPFKTGDPSPLRRLATIADDAATIRVDPAHTYAIQGWGKDLCSSSLLLLVRFKVLPGRSLEAALDFGYELFRQYCSDHGKTTSITHFNKQTLKIDSLFGG
ncbi:Khdc3 [Symbiodinium sp. CCMP2592]|nr:Khdc3 [Symbiodinium sp. CCMP2592]